MYRAVLDTCALVPGLQRDFLLQLAAEQTYSPLWGTGILHELDYVLERLDAAREVPNSEGRRRQLFTQMQRAFPGACIEAPKNGDYTHYQLLDPDDGHVAHASIMGKADAIVTDDRRAGFDISPTLASAQVEVLRPQTFAANTVVAHLEAGSRALHALANRSAAPPRTPQQILQLLAAKHQMTEVAELLNDSA